MNCKIYVALLCTSLMVTASATHKTSTAAKTPDKKITLPTPPTPVLKSWYELTDSGKPATITENSKKNAIIAKAHGKTITLATITEVSPKTSSTHIYRVFPNELGANVLNRFLDTFVRHQKIGGAQQKDWVGNLRTYLSGTPAITVFALQAAEDGLPSLIVHAEHAKKLPSDIQAAITAAQQKEIPTPDRTLANGTLDNATISKLAIALGEFLGKN